MAGKLAFFGRVASAGGGGGGTVMSVAMTVPTGLSVSGSPITTSGTFIVTLTAGYFIPTTAEQTNWNSAYTNRITSLTTTGTSGAATLISNVLNIPQYTDAYTGTVTSVAWTTSQGVSASIANATTTPNITITLGALTGVTSFNGLVVTANTGVITTGTWNATAIGDSYITSTLTGKTYNGLSLTSLATGFSIAGGTTPKTLTINNTLQLSGTDSSTLDISTGGTLGTAAFTNSTAYEVPLTFSTGLTRSVNTITVNTTQNIAKLSNLTSNGFVKTSGGDGTLSIDTTAYGTGSVTSVAWTTSQGVSASIANATTTPNITITLGALTGVTSFNGLVVTANTGVITTGTWNATVIGVGYGGNGLSTVAAGSVIGYNTLDTASAVTSTSGLKALQNSGGTITWNTSTGTGDSVFGTTPTFTTNITTPLVLGGSAVGSAIELRSTSGTGTSSGLSHLISGGTGGATPIISAYNDAQVIVNGGVASTRNPTALGTLRVMQGTSTIDIGEVTTSIGAIWINQTTPSTTNYILRGSPASSTILNCPAAASNINFSFAGTTRYQFDQNSIVLTPTTSGIATALFKFTTPASTAVTASTEINSLLWSHGTSRQWSAGALALQREWLINAPTYRAVTASTFTDVANVGIAGAPIAFTNMTFTNSHGLLIGASAVNGTGGTVTNSYGLTVNAQTGATNNYSAQFLGGATKFAAGTTTYAPITLTSGTNMTTAAAGNVEYDGTNLFFTISGTTRLSINCSSSGATAPATSNIGVVVDYYGTSATRVLTTPNSWELVNIGGTNYKRPLYL